MTEREAIELWNAIVKELAGKGVNLDPRWKLEFDKARKRFGCAHWKRNVVTRVIEPGRITMSLPLTLLNDAEKVGKTMRHEIGHAMAGHAAGHGPVWRAWDIKCGGDGSRCYSEEVEKVELPWQATCGNCGHTHHRTRPVKPGRIHWCGRCPMGRHPSTTLKFAYCGMSGVKSAAVSSDSLVRKVLEMRASGMGFVAIDAAHGIFGKKGFWSWKICKENS